MEQKRFKEYRIMTLAERQATDPRSKKRYTQLSDGNFIVPKVSEDETKSESTGELHDLGRARRQAAAKHGTPPSALDKLGDALGVRGDQPTVVSGTELDEIANSAEVDDDVRETARAISGLLHDRVGEVVAEQEVARELGQRDEQGGE